jgi:hypothetical protein|tara:strand:+ start:173 stop:520 length:348 start_codon:yes stop_codon:yes gene_type:complete
MDIENLKKNPEQVKQLIELLSSLLDTNEDIPKQPNQSNDNKPRNKFLDMSEFRSHKDDAELDKKLHADYKPIPRNRSFQNINVRCRICGREENISPGLVSSYDRYKCNKCSGTPG